MRRPLALVLLFAAISGCSAYDALFGVLGNHYTGEGGNDLDKRRHYENRVESLHGFEDY